VTNIAASSYALAAIGFLALGLPVLSGWRGLAQRGTLSAACLLTAAWAGALAWNAWHGITWHALTAALEVLRDGAWAMFLIALLGNWRREGADDQRNPLLAMRPSVRAAVCAYLALVLALVAGYWNQRVLSTLGLSIMIAFMASSVYGMLLVEQVYRNKTIEERWAIKFACLGVGGMFAYDFYMYSNTVLFRELNPDLWMARGVVNALTVPLVAASMARRRAWTTSFAMSRRIVFHSAALFGSAIYLLAMGSVGYYLRYFGGSWGTVMQTGFLFGAICLLGVILFSGTARSWLKVWISKHFYTYTYDYREEWMRFTRTLSGSSANLGERAIEALAALVESPGGALWQRSDGGTGESCYEPHSHWQGTAGSALEAPNSPFCQFLQTTQWVIDVDEYVERPEKYEGLLLPDWLLAYPRRWLVVPLILHEKLFGFVVLQRPRSPLKLNWEIIDLLEIAGSQAASNLAQEQAANALMVARQFESFNRMSTFVVHDLKNLVAQLSLMNANAEKHKDNPEFQRDMLETLNHSVQKMKLLLQKLGRTENAAKPLPQVVDQVVRQAVALKSAFEPRPHLLVEEAGLSVVADRERLERVLGHLIQNAIEATPRDGNVMIRVGRRIAADADDAVEVEIADTGEGMTGEFIRERLFKPFDSTKSAGMGIGVFESREYITELGGSLEVTSEPGIGTTFKVILPLYRVPATALTA
jgi:putative PEP-CTERM system histidine kinase